MPDYTLTLEEQPTQADVATIYRWITDYNLVQIGDHWKGRLTILARDQDGQLVGGVYGFTDRSWLRIEVLAIQEQLRHQGLGSRLLTAAEDEARRRGCHAAWLDTSASRRCRSIRSTVIRSSVRSAGIPIPIPATSYRNR